ncbi:MAG: hypothetical protein VXY20_05900 [Pseudomonadota bacterium]|nr:hypothetical protein [Pseudomonadota bacterium]
MPPFHAAFKDLDLPFEEWHLADGTFDISAPPPKGIFFNRMSASTHTRGHDFAPELTASVLAWLEAYGRRTINGGHALDLEISKNRQYAAMSRVSNAFPETQFAIGTEAILNTARKIGCAADPKAQPWRKGSRCAALKQSQ